MVYFDENNLKSAFKAASKQYFPPKPVIPAEEFFTMLQYNTWIELMYNQNQKDILQYADDILKNTFLHVC